MSQAALDILSSRAWRYLEHRRFAEAEEACQTLLQQPGLDGDMLILAVEIAEARGAYETALKRAQEAAEALPGNSAAWAALGRSLLRSGESRDAVQAWWRTVRLDPLKSSGWAHLSISASLAGRPKLAVKARRMLERVALPGVARRELARAWILAGAAVMVRSMQEQDPVENIWQTMLERAAAHHRHDADGRPFDADAQHRLSVCETLRGQHDEAELANVMALRADPDHDAALQWRRRIQRAA